MFTLLIIVLTTANIYTHVVDKYDTRETCETAKAALVKEFQQTYPGQHDYAFECLLPAIKE